MNLTLRDQAKFHGEQAKARQMAVRVQVRVLPVFSAQKFLDITAALIDSSLFQGDATLEYVERLSTIRLGSEGRRSDSLDCEWGR